jgi:hypothetical protein
VAKLSEMSFKKAIPEIVRKLDEIGREKNRLYRRNELREWRGNVVRGQMWYYASFDAKDARLLEICLGVQQVLILTGHRWPVSQSPSRVSLFLYKSCSLFLYKNLCHELTSLDPGSKLASTNLV